MALLMLVLLVLNIGFANAMDTSSITEDPSTSYFQKYLLAPQASRLEMRGEFFSSGNALVRRLMIGSAAPECGHTCGACSPCKVEVVSFECNNEVGVHAEGCPLGYLCICHGNAFPIP